jgi:hypothetical protein
VVEDGQRQLKLRLLVGGDRKAQFGLEDVKVPDGFRDHDRSWLSFTFTLNSDTPTDASSLCELTEQPDPCLFFGLRDNFNLEVGVPNSLLQLLRTDRHRDPAPSLDQGSNSEFRVLLEDRD